MRRRRGYHRFRPRRPRRWAWPAGAGSQIEEQRIRTLLRELGDRLETPTEHDLRAAARAVAAEPRQPQPRPTPHRPRRSQRLRWAGGAAALLLAATGLGFGFGTWLTPTGSAGSDVLGLGFLPAKGWTVVQSGTTDSAASARAIAANVPLDPADRVDGTPENTLRALSESGVVILARMTTRGNPRTDALFPLRTLPLRFVDARIESDVSEPVASERRLTQYRLRAGVDGYNVDARVYFGVRPPSVSALDAAERQLRRLVVAPEQVTIAVRPSIVSARRPVTVYGSVASGKAGEKVTVQFKQCGLYPIQFRDHAEVTTEAGGGWSIGTGVESNGPFRAVAGGDVSSEVRVQRRADVRLSPRPPGRFEAYVVERASFWRKRVVIQRFDRRLGRWAKVKTLVLVKSFAAPGSLYVWSSTDKFAVNLPKGTNIRAVLPRDQAKPCHIGGYSNLLRT